MIAGNQFGAIFCGGGPAATGLVVCAAADGRLEELLARGLCIIERGRLLGPGALGSYPISANTRGSTFLRSLERIGPGVAWDPVRTAAATHAVHGYRDAFPQLTLVGQHLEAVGRAVQDVVASASDCEVLTDQAVREVSLRANGGVAVTYAPSDGGADRTVTADHAVIAMGGVPRPRLEQLRLLPGLTLAPYSDKLCHSASVLDDRVGLPAGLRRAVARAGEVVVVGGSHSAWSAAWRLLQDPALRAEDGRPTRVTVLHRTPPRFFFWDVAAARAAGYAFDELDVCPQTGMVNRHGGLRSDAHDLAWSVTQGGSRLPVSAIGLADEPAARAAAEHALDAAGAVVAAVGYRPRLPSLRRSDGSSLQLATDARGHLVTDRTRLVSEEGTVLPELLAFGLGAGLAASGELAGEPSYVGRLDAVSLYQAEAGRIALDVLLGSPHS